MKILHLTYHYGCSSDLNYVFKALGHEIEFFDATCWPYDITEALAHQIWNERRDYFQSFDAVITSDTVSLSIPFLLHFEELKPRLIIWICNRFNVCTSNPGLLVALLTRYKDRVSLIPYIEYERRWCSRFGIEIDHETIHPLGRHVEPYLCNEQRMHECFCPLTRDGQTVPDGETIFVPDYYNNRRLLPLLQNAGVSYAHGRYMDLSEIRPYKAVVSLPDAFGKIFYHEAIQHEIVVLIPSPRFMDELAGVGDYFITSKEYEPCHEIHTYCEYYKFEGCYIYYDSFDDLVSKIRNLDALIPGIRATLKARKDAIHDRILDQWRRVLGTEKTVAIYNGFMFHHEMFGHAIEYCKRHNYRPVLFTNDIGDLGWIDFYKNHFGNLAIHKHTELTDRYDAVILLTDDDWAFPEKSIDPKKIVCIDHYYKIRRTSPSPLNRFDIRRFQRTEKDRWALPVYQIVPKELKLAEIANRSRVRVACIGVGGVFDVDRIRKAFPNFDDIEFHVFNRDPYQVRAISGPNIRMYIMENSPTMIDLLQTCHYSMFVPVDRSFYEEKMSGSVPLAFSTGCRIITTQELKGHYHLQSCLVIDEPKELCLPSSEDIDNVYIELETLQKRRDMWYNAFISV